MNRDKIKWFKKEELNGVAIGKIKPVLVGFDIGTGIVSHDYLRPVVYVCCEPFQEYAQILADKVSEKKDSIFIIQNKDWAESLKGLENKSIDAVYLIDVVEHLPKEEGLELLKRTEEIVRKQIVIFTPLGFVKQEVMEGGKDAWGLNGAEYQEHKSGWMTDDFDSSWEIYACKDYHDTNNVGRKLDEPFGAFWAIKNFNDEVSELAFDSLPQEVKNAIVNKLPSAYFERIEKLQKKELEHQKLLSEYEILKSSKAVRYANKLKKCLRKIGVKQF